MAKTLDSLLVMTGDGNGDCNPTLVLGKYASVDYYPEPEAEESESFSWPSMEKRNNLEERGAGAITLRCHHHAYFWKQKYNGRNMGKTAPAKVRIVRDEDAQMLRDAHAAVLAAQAAYREARVKAYANAQRCTAKVAKRLVDDWPEAQHCVNGKIVSKGARGED